MGIEIPSDPCASEHPRRGHAGTGVRGVPTPRQFVVLGTVAELGTYCAGGISSQASVGTAGVEGCGFELCEIGGRGARSDRGYGV